MRLSVSREISRLSQKPFVSRSLSVFPLLMAGHTLLYCAVINGRPHSFIVQKLVGRPLDGINAFSVFTCDFSLLVKPLVFRCDFSFLGMSLRIPSLVNGRPSFAYK